MTLSPDEMRAYQNAYLWRRRKAWIHVNGPCKDCGSTDDLQAFQTDTTQKRAALIWSYSKRKRDPVLATCIVLCAPCVAKRHRLYPDIVHGTSATYKHYGCRCEPCRRANSSMTSRKRAKRRARFRSLPNADAPTAPPRAGGRGAKHHKNRGSAMTTDEKTAQDLGFPDMCSCKKPKPSEITETALDEHGGEVAVDSCVVCDRCGAMISNWNNEELR